jgi:hypothetical protein
MGNPRAILVAAVFLGWTAAAGAQTIDRRMELGIGAGGAASWWIPDLPAVAGPEIRVSIPTSDRKSIEALGGVSTVRLAGDTVGFYGVQRQRRLQREPESKVQSFISYGVIGVFFHSRSPEYRYRAANGSTVVVPASSQTLVVPPILGLLGGGAERQIASRLKARVEVQAVMALVIPAAVRVSAGVSMGLGKTR